jgi:hypothetical protein
MVKGLTLRGNRNGKRREKKRNTLRNWNPPTAKNLLPWVSNGIIHGSISIILAQPLPATTVMYYHPRLPGIMAPRHQIVTHRLLNLGIVHYE